MSKRTPLYGRLRFGHRRGRPETRTASYDRRMDCKSDYGSFRLGTGSPLSDPRLRSGLWHCLHPTTSINGHSRPTNVATLPWQNGYAERLIGSIRRECLDHVVVFGARLSLSET